MSRTLGLLLLLVLWTAAAAAADDAPLSPLLTSLLAADETDADGRLAVWVSFVDKGVRGAALDAALDAAERGLDPRARRRRAKTAPPGGRLLDASDLPVHRPYLEAVAASGARLRRTSRWLNAASFDATPEQVRALAALPFVRGLDAVRRFRRADELFTPGPRPRASAAKTDALDYGGSLSELEQTNVPPVHAEGWTGDGVLIGMMDTGFNLTHEALDAVDVIAAWDFVNDDGDVANETGDPPNAQNHGTMTLSTVGGHHPGALIGPAFEASYVLAKTEDVSTEIPAEEDDWVAGIEWLDGFGVDIVNSSLGYHDWYEFADLDGGTALCTIAADLAVAKGIVVLNSAGNERGTAWGHLITPADGDSVITVGAVTSADIVTTFSSPGPTADGRIKPDVAARGQGNHVASPTEPDGYGSVSGTSFACPLTSGVAALLLQRVPQLTPLQVREALRETADRPHAPDNDYGWGVIDAWAAVHYYGAAFAHEPLADTEDTTGPYVVDCIITDRVALAPSTLKLRWRLSGGVWQHALLTSAGGDAYSALIPGQADGADLEYYLEAGDELGVATTLPVNAPAAVFTFHVGADHTPPQVVHTPLGDQPQITWPADVRAYASDNVEIASVTVDWSRDGAPQTSFPLSPAGGDLWVGSFPGAGLPDVGEEIVYSVIAVDAAAGANTTVHGPHAFRMIVERGVVLVLDDGAAKCGADLKIARDKSRPAAPAAKAASSAADLVRWLEYDGYIVHAADWATFTADDLEGMQLLVIAAGGNPSPLEGETPRHLTRQWAGDGGRLLIEGGEVGYDAVATPGYPEFRDDVLHVAEWRGDDAGDLTSVPGCGDHPLLTTPNAILPPVAVAYADYVDQDALTPAADAALVLATVSDAGAGGLLAYDDTASPLGGQIVVMPFRLAALADSMVARDLLENAAAWLVADEGLPDASLGGVVETLDPGTGLTPVAGAVVTAGYGLVDTTGVDGRWDFPDAYAGPYVLSAVAPGFAPVTEAVTLASGEAVTDLRLVLPLAVSEDLVWTGPQSIPDDDPAGLAATVTAPEGGRVADVDVSILLSHPWPGDLTVDLISPTGTQVRLHDRGTTGVDSLAGTWDVDLTVAGPGALAEFRDEEPAGAWTLRVRDLAAGDAGGLESWTLHLVTALHLTGVEVPPMRTGLVGARPNPFNPRTEIVYDLARAAEPVLGVHDLRGRLVRRLLGGVELPAGRHRATWDGRDDRGRPAASGAYVVRLEAAGTTTTAKIVLAR